METNTSIHNLTPAIFLAFGIFAAAFGVESFLIRGSLIDGGVTGISMLLSGIYDVPLSILIPVINLPFLAFGYRHIGKHFALKGALAILAFSVVMTLVHFPPVTNDRLLNALFGGFFLGAGIGLAIRGGAVLDGTEIAALVISKTSHLLKVGDIILLLNIFIFIAAAFFLGIDTAMYSIITYIAASKTVDFIVYGIEEYHGITIVSLKHEEIKNAVLHDLGRGMTVYRGRGGLSGSDQDILYCVVTRLEIPKVKEIISEIDPNCFVVINHIADTSGGIVKRRMHH